MKRHDTAIWAHALNTINTVTKHCLISTSFKQCDSFGTYVASIYLPN